MALPELLTLVQLAELLQVSKSTVYRLVEQREIRFYKVGGCLRFDKKDILDYLERNKVEAIRLK